MSLIRPLAKDRNTRVFRGYLAEEYDGIGQWILVTLSRGSTSGAMRAKLGAGDFNTGAHYPVGTPVALFFNHGLAHILDLGTRGLDRLATGTQVPIRVDLNLLFGTDTNDPDNHPFTTFTNPWTMNDGDESTGNGHTSGIASALETAYLRIDLGASYEVRAVAYYSHRGGADGVPYILQLDTGGGYTTVPMSAWINNNNDGVADGNWRTANLNTPTTGRYWRFGWTYGPGYFPEAYRETVKLVGYQYQ